MYYPDYINYFKERIIESNNLDQIKWRAKFTRNNRNKRMLNLNGINHTFLNTMECKKRLVEIAPQVWRIALSLREGVVFQSRSTSNVSTHLLEIARSVADSHKRTFLVNLAHANRSSHVRVFSLLAY